MPKRLKTHPNERIDAVDFEHGAVDYTSEHTAFQNERILLDRRSRVLEGFRLQVTGGNVLTVHNGTAIARDGKILRDESSPATSVSETLATASADHYIEIEFVEDETDVDARAFWDPTYNNGVGVPTGKEFSTNVSTRKTPSWQIVKPISTTGFTVSTTPGTSRIPLAVITTNASSVIVTVATPPLVPASSVLEEALAGTVTSFRVLDASVFPPTGLLNVGLDSVTVTSIDYVENIITVSSVSLTHAAGTIVNTSASEFIPERTAAKPDWITGAPTSHDDQVFRFWQGDEERGSAVMASKHVLAGRDDLNVRSLKDQVDMLAAQLRELKFGSPLSSVTSIAPPTSFTSTRYYDRVGSVAGARNASVSIGNGTTSFGDFNGTDHAPFAAAIAALTSGGTIYVNAGTYTFTSSVTIDNKRFRFVGEERDRVVLTHASAQVFSITNGSDVQFDNLSITGSSANAAISVATGARSTLRFTDAKVTNAISAQSVEVSVQALRTRFVTTSSSALFSHTGTGLFADSACYSCYFSATSSSCLNAPVSGFLISGSEVVFSSTSKSVFEVPASSNSYRLHVQGTNVVASAVSNAQPSLLYVPAGSSLQTSTFDSVRSSGTFTGTSGQHVRITGASNNVCLRECTFNTTTGATSDEISVILLDSATGVLHKNVKVEGCSFYEFYAAVHQSGGTSSGLCVSNCWMYSTAARAHDQYGVYQTGTGTTISNAKISGNFFEMTGSTSDNIGVYVTGDVFEGVISDNTFHAIGSSSSISSINAAMFFDTDPSDLVISGNEVKSVATGNNGRAYGIYVEGTGSTSKRLVVTSNRVEGVVHTGTTTSGSYSAGMYFKRLYNLTCSANVIVNISGAATTPTRGIEVQYADGTCTANAIEGISHVAAIYAVCFKVQEVNSFVVSSNRINATGTNCGYALQHVFLVDGQVSLLGNEIKMGASTLYGIESVATGSGGIDSLSICNNIVHGQQNTTLGSKGISFDSGTNANNGITINENIVTEMGYFSVSEGIFVDGNSTSTTKRVSISDNIVQSTDASASGVRAGAGISLANLSQFVANNNVVEWAIASLTTGIQIQLADCDSGTVNSNFIMGTSGTAPGESIELTIDGDCSDVLVSGNADQFAGSASIAPEAAAATNLYTGNKLTCDNTYPA